MNARRILLSLLAALLTGWTWLIVAPVARAGGPTSWARAKRRAGRWRER